MIFDVQIPDCFPKTFLLLYVIHISFIYKHNTTYYISYSYFFSAFNIHHKFLMSTTAKSLIDSVVLTARFHDITAAEIYSELKKLVKKEVSNINI